MRIQLFDRGLPAGKKLFSDLDEICRRLQLDDPQYSRDMGLVYSRGLQGNTILLINNEVVLIDQYPPKSELEAIISDYLK